MFEQMLKIKSLLAGNQERYFYDSSCEEGRSAITNSEGAIPGLLRTLLDLLRDEIERGGLFTTLRNCQEHGSKAI
ncbi:hypothetical protein ACS0TY_030738 [Phlomoides rotata]